MPKQRGHSPHAQICKLIITKSVIQRIADEVLRLKNKTQAVFWELIRASQFEDF